MASKTIQSYESELEKGRHREEKSKKEVEILLRKIDLQVKARGELEKLCRSLQGRKTQEIIEEDKRKKEKHEEAAEHQRMMREKIEKLQSDVSGQLIQSQTAYKTAMDENTQLKERLAG